MEQERKIREHQDKKREYETKLADIENQEAVAKDKLIRMTQESPEIVPEIIEYIPEDTGLYKGYVGEIERRVQEGQIKKTIKATRERVEEVKNLWQGIAALHRSKVEVKKALSELGMADIEINTKEKKIMAENEMADIEISTKKKKIMAENARVDLETDLEKLRLETEKAKLKKEKRGALTESPKTMEEQFREKLEKEKTRQQFTAEFDAVKSFGAFEKRRKIVEQYEEKKKGILNGRRLSELNKAELDALEDLEDFKDDLLSKS